MNVINRDDEGVTLELPAELPTEKPVATNPNDPNAPLIAFTKAVRGLKRDAGVHRMEGNAKGERGGLGWRIWWLWFADGRALQLHVTGRSVELMERMSVIARIPNGPDAYANTVKLIQAARSPASVPT